MKTKNIAKNISKYENNKRYEYNSYSNMTLSQTPIYMLFHFHILYVETRAICHTFYAKYFLLVLIVSFWHKP